MSIYQDSSKMWNDLRSRWTDNTVLVFASPLARERFIFKEKIVFKKEAISLIDLWDRCGFILEREGESLPSAVIDEEIIPLIRSAALSTKSEDLKDLARHKSGFRALLNHLIHIERVADIDYRPTNGLEEGVDDIRKSLLREGKTTLAALQSQIARRAKNIDLEKKEIIFAPLPDHTPQLGGLIKGLAEKNTVSLFELSRFNKEDLFSLTGLEEKKASVDLNSPSLVYFKNELPLRKKDQLEKGMAQARQWLEEEKSVALVVPSVEEWLDDIIPVSNKFDIDLFYRDFKESKGLSLAHFLVYLEINLAQYSTDRFNLDIDFFLPEIKGEDMPVFDFESEKEGIEKMRFLIMVGRSLDFQYNARPWLERLERVVDDLEKTEFGLSGQSIETILLETGFPLRLRGEPSSALLLNYQDLAQTEIDSAIFFGFDQSGFNLKPKSAFVSKNLAEKVPNIKKTNVPLMVDQAILSPKKEALLLRGENYLPLPIEARLSFLKFKEPHFKIGKEPSLSPAVLAKIEEEINLGSDEKESYSVSELESYLSCPRGWFVKYRLCPKRSQSKEAKLGELRHFVLENLEKGFSENDIEFLVDDFLEKNSLFLEAGEKLNISQGIEDTANIFFSEYWPFSFSQNEVSFEEEYRIDFEKTVKIKGKADRVDWEGRDFLLTDFKSSAQGKYNHLLQIDLYPELIYLKHKREILKEEGLDYLAFEFPESQADLNRLEEIEKSLPQCIGSIYFSVPDQKISGWYSPSLIGVFPEKQYLEIKRLGSVQLAEKVNRALMGMSDPSSYLEIGDNCGRFCPHRFLGGFR